MSSILDDNKVFFNPGDLVIVKHKDLQSPVMLVQDKIVRPFKGEDGEHGSLFVGMRCIWFDKNKVLQSAVFSTKDLKLYK